MVFHVPEQDEQEMASMTAHLHLSNSQCLKRSAFGPSLHLWRCSAEPHPAIAFWIGEGTSCYSYLGLYPAKLGTLDVLQGKRAWTALMYRKRGLGTALLLAAAAETPLMTDTEGMTLNAYNLWRSIPNFTRRWWDAQNSKFVPEADVPMSDRFTHWELVGKRYQLVLSI